MKRKEGIKMTIREAREKTLEEYSRSASGSKIMSAVLYILGRQQVKELTEVLDLEERAQSRKRKGR